MSKNRYKSRCNLTIAILTLCNLTIAILTLCHVNHCQQNTCKSALI